MVKHIVIWRLKETAEGNDKDLNMKNLKIQLESLKAEIKEIRKLEVGINFSDRDVASDLLLYSEFETTDDLDTYCKHPKHLKVADFARSVASEIRVVDFDSLQKKRRPGCKC